MERTARATIDLRRFARRLAALIAVGLVGAWVLGFLLPLGWLTSLFQHFVAGYALAWCAVLALAWWGGARGPRLVVPGLLAAAWAVFWAAPRWPQDQPELADSQPLRVVGVNLWHDHAVVEEFVAWLDTLDPPVDVIGLGEVHEARSLALLREHFADGLSDPSSGVALFSRLPLTQTESLLFDRGRPLLRADLELGGQSVSIFSGHALVPVGGGHQELLAEMGRRVGAREHAVLLADLNTTPWAREFHGLLRAGGLRDARRGSWPWATWQRRGRSALFRLPIDHVLVRGAVRVQAFTRAPDLGSDHRALLVDLEVGSPGATRSGGSLRD
jgi:endonuclease/exonuclease/phosphatase (EEP) superfamily protein YafD